MQLLGAPTYFQRGVVVSSEEHDAGCLRPVTLREAVLQLHTRGYVILRRAIEPAIVEAARDAFAAVLQDCASSGREEQSYQVSPREHAVFWQRGSRWRVFPKLRPPLSDPWLLANPFVLAILQQLLGDGFYCKYVSSDTCVRGSELQSPHREMGAGLTWEPSVYLVNVPLVHCGLHNGPLEIWPGGSHLWSSAVLARLGLDTETQDGCNPEFEAFLADWPSCFVELFPGDLLIRDPGMLHRGTPNPSDEPRTMLTQCFFRRRREWNYGRLDYNLDAQLYAGLAPDVQRLFAHGFTPRGRLRWRQRDGRLQRSLAHVLGSPTMWRWRFGGARRYGL